MQGIVDIHNHIIYGVDDGSQNIEMSMNMIAEEYVQGVRDIILTPHFDVNGCMPDPARVKSHFLKLKELTAKEYPEMTLHLGNEVFACFDMIRWLEEGVINTMGDSKYVLVEFFPMARYDEMLRYLSQLVNNGYIPIIAHCERYKTLRKRFKVIDEYKIKHLIDMGCYFQINTQSVHKFDVRFTKKMIEKDFLHFIATDAHSMGRRGIYWDECIEYLESKYSSDYLEWLLIQNPRKVLAGEYI